MNKLIFTFITLLFLNNCSFNENSRIWKDKKNNLETNKNLTKVLTKDKKVRIPYYLKYKPERIELFCSRSYNQVGLIFEQDL